MIRNPSNMSNYTEPTLGAFRWELLKTIEKEILKVDGTIFGGFVSDSIIHNHYAELYYKAKNDYYEESIDESLDQIFTNQPNTLDLRSVHAETEPTQPPTLEETKKEETPVWSYTNPKSHMESWPHRTRQPEDIDFVIHPARLQQFLANIREAGIEYMQLFRHNVRFYLPVEDRHNIEHIRFSVTISVPWKFAKYMTLPKAHLDVILDPDYMIGKTAIPYGQADFECNQIILTKHGYEFHGISHPMRRLENLQKIIRDILLFKAVPIRAPKYRMMRMLNKGYKIVSSNYSVIKNSESITPVDGCCLHCLEEFHPADFSVKNKCCQARYHISCYMKTQQECTVQYNNVDYCALCRSKMDNGTEI